MSQQPTPPSWPGGLRPLTQTEERNWAMAAHLGAIVAAMVALGVLAPLAILLFVGNRSDFVRRHATESLNFQISILLYLAAAFGLTLLTVGLALLILVPVGLAAAVLGLVVVVAASLAASRGEDYRYPLTLRLVS